MSSLPNYADTLSPVQGPEPFLVDITDLADDESLLAELWAKNQENDGYFSEETGLRFANSDLAHMVHESYSTEQLDQLEAFLAKKGTVGIPIETGQVTVDGTKYDISFVAATEVDPNSPNHGDMSSMLYLRDHVQAASVLMDLHLQDPERYDEEGKTGHNLLMSGLHLMSTPAQLARFNDVIERGNETGQEDWPHISLHFNDLEATGPNGWRNKQDTFQMLAYVTLDAIEQGFLDASELSDAHKKFLGSIIPLLASVGFPKYENSGSWEEITANRTSVMAIETALLSKIKTLTEKDSSFDFFKEGYGKDSFHESLDTMIHNGLHEIGRRLPYESPDYDPDSIKHREADAALAYVLMYDLPNLLSDAQVPIGPEAQIMQPQEIENLVLKQLSTLIDPVSNGMNRYKEDSYQRVNFHTNKIQFVIKAIKRKVKKDAEHTGREVDLDEKQDLRGKFTPQGRPAAWTHPLGQLSSWAAKRSLQEADPKDAEHYSALSSDFLNQVLSTMTGEDQWHATLNGNGEYHVRKAPAFKLPECLITYASNGNILIVPSPHTPLNWSSAETKHAVGLLRLSRSRLS